MLGNGLHLLGITLQFGIMSHSGLCRIGDYVAIVAFGIMSIWHYVTFGIMSHLALCRIRHYVAFGVTPFRIMSFGIMSHSAFCRIRTYVVRDCVIWDCVVRCNVVRRNFVRRNVLQPILSVYQIVRHLCRCCISLPGWAYVLSNNLFLVWKANGQAPV